MVCTRLRQECHSQLKEFLTLLISWDTMWEQFSSHQVLETSALKRLRLRPRTESEEEEFNLDAEADIFNLAVERKVFRELSDARAAEASEDQEEDLMDIQADHQVALTVRSEAASPSLGVDLQAEAARPHHHLTEDLQQQHRPRQADHLQESRETRAWRLRWPS